MINLDILQSIKQLADNQKLLASLRDLLQQNVEKEQQLMSAITDWAAKEQADLTAISATLDAIVVGVKALDDLITAFQNSPGALSPADQAALDGIQAASAALVTKSAGIDVTPPAKP